MKQKKEYQDRQDTRLGEIMFLDYMNDPFFNQWTLEQRREYDKKQTARLKLQKIDWLTDVRFTGIGLDYRQKLKKKICGRDRAGGCVIS